MGCSVFFVDLLDWSFEGKGRGVGGRREGKGRKRGNVCKVEASFVGLNSTPENMII